MGITEKGTKKHAPLSKAGRRVSSTFLASDCLQYLYYLNIKAHDYYTRQYYCGTSGTDSMVIFTQHDSLHV